MKQQDWLSTPSAQENSCVNFSKGETFHLPDAELKFYPQFYSSAISANHLKHLLAHIPWQQYYLRIAGKNVLVPRLQAWFGDAECYYGYSGLQLSPQPWTPTLSEIKNDIESLLNLKFNSVLLNWYRNGNDSVGWHADDEKELGDDPHIASLSFGETRNFELKRKTDKTQTKRRIALNDGSLLLMGSGVQKHWLHQIPKQPGLIGDRVNLTFRFIPTMA